MVAHLSLKDALIIVVSFAKSLNQSLKELKGGDRDRRLRAVFPIEAYHIIFDALVLAHGYETTVDFVNKCIDLAAEETSQGSDFSRLPIPKKEDCAAAAAAAALEFPQVKVWRS